MYFTNEDTLLNSLHSILLVPEKRHISASSEGRIGPNSRVGAPPLSSRLRGPPTGGGSSELLRFVVGWFLGPGQGPLQGRSGCNPSQGGPLGASMGPRLFLCRPAGGLCSAALKSGLLSGGATDPNARSRSRAATGVCESPSNLGPSLPKRTHRTGGSLRLCGPGAICTWASRRARRHAQAMH